MPSIAEGDKIRLKSGEIARVVEVYEPGAAYEAEIFRPGGEFGIVIDTVRHEEIFSVFKETEHPLAHQVSAGGQSKAS